MTAGSGIGEGFSAEELVIIQLLLKGAGNVHRGCCSRRMKARDLPPPRPCLPAGFTCAGKRWRSFPAACSEIKGGRESIVRSH